MAGFYKCVLKGLALTQEINNILFYGPAIPLNETFDPAVAEELGEKVGAAWIASVLPVLTNVYTLDSVDVSMVNEDGETISPYIVTVATPGGGIVGEAVDTVAQVMIAKFNCTPSSTTPTHPVPRRSYIAIGPLVASQIGQGGALTSQAAMQAAVAPAVTQGHLVSATEYLPYRIGRTEAPSTTNPEGTIAGVGRVVAVTVRPYSSFRRSRLTSPTGN